MLHVFPDKSSFSAQLARRLRTTPKPIAIHRFPDGESLVRVHPTVARHAIVVCALDAPNAKLIEVLQAADALRRSGVRRVTLVAPYLPYMRQDAVFHPGEPLTQQVFAGLLRQGFDRVLTLEAHLHRIAALSAVIPGRSISAAPAIAEWIQHTAPGALIVGPDSESAPWVRAIARRAGQPWLVGNKRRLGDRRVEIDFAACETVKHAVLVDDIASSGVTLAVAARALRRRGIEQIDAAVVHAIFAADALRRIRAAGIRRVVSCNSVAHRTNRIDCSALFSAPLSRGFK